MTPSPLPPRPPSGRLIAFEGIDGSGKSTQARMLLAELERKGIPAVLLREPTDGPVGREIRHLARAGRLEPRREFELFVEDRRDDVARNILPALGRGAVVLMDRYYISSIAYQGALGIDPEEIRLANEAFAPRPDLTFLFDLPVEEALARIARRGGGPDHFERRDYQERVRAIFQSLDWDTIHRLDSTRPIHDVRAEITATVEGLLARA